MIWRISIFLLHTLLVVFLCVFVGWLLLDLGKVYRLETPAAHVRSAATDADFNCWFITQSISGQCVIYIEILITGI